jgi:ABC-type spermidine/putrescine transport system permease subunit I
MLIGFGLGVLAVRYFPQVANPLGIPALIAGMILFLIAAKGFFRSSKETAN